MLASSRRGARVRASPSPASRRAAHHWLPERWRAWLDRFEHAWWRRGILARLRSDPRLSGAGREARLLDDIERAADALVAKHAPRFASTHASDAARDLSHARFACRALAARKIVAPHVRSDDVVVRWLGEHHGGERVAADAVSALVAGSLALSRDPVETVVRMVRAMAHDHGDVGWRWRVVRDEYAASHAAAAGPFRLPREGAEEEASASESQSHSQSQSQSASRDATPGPNDARRLPRSTLDEDENETEDEDESVRSRVAFEMRTDACLYHDVFVLEGASDLARATCCSVDGARWFARAERFGARVTRPEALSEGDAHCVIRVERTGSRGV